MPSLNYERVQVALPRSDLSVVASHLFPLMMRNVATDGFTFADPNTANGHPRLSRPGCVLASPSYAANLARVDQDYVHHWTRDAAVAAMEIAHGPADFDQQLADYVAFSRTCQDSTDGATFYRARFEIDGSLSPWSDQKDGPALQTLAFVEAFGRLDEASRATAVGVAQKNVDRTVADWSDDTGKRNAWEEVDGASFFARAVQLRCLREVTTTNTLGLVPPAAIDEAVDGLAAALGSHWNDGGGYYASVVDPTLPRGSIVDLGGYDPNIDIVMAAIYGAVSPTEPRLLATAAKIREQWDVGGRYSYPVNAADRALGIGPLLGRYPSDIYDGNWAQDVEHPTRNHPWALCTANFAQLYYLVAAALDAGPPVEDNELSRPFFTQVGVEDPTDAAAAVPALKDAGDRMLKALIYHSDHFELSEQFDADTGYEKSVTNLTWSYAAYLSAERARRLLPDR